MPTDTKWALGRTSPKKRIHRGDCQYARRPYVWAADRSESDLGDALVAEGAHRWHDAGICCCGALDRRLRLARRAEGLEM